MNKLKADGASWGEGVRTATLEFIKKYGSGGCKLNWGPTSAGTTNKVMGVLKIWRAIARLKNFLTFSGVP
jgi:hypothetical protein